MNADEGYEVWDLDDRAAGPRRWFPQNLVPANSASSMGSRLAELPPERLKQLLAKTRDHVDDADWPLYEQFKEIIGDAGFGLEIIGGDGTQSGARTAVVAPTGTPMITFLTDPSMPFRYAGRVAPLAAVQGTHRANRTLLEINHDSLPARYAAERQESTAPELPQLHDDVPRSIKDEFRLLLRQFPETARWAAQYLGMSPHWAGVFRAPGPIVLDVLASNRDSRGVIPTGNFSGDLGTEPGNQVDIYRVKSGRRGSPEYTFIGARDQGARYTIHPPPSR